jgi:ABC-type glycerol-3-phosphate transport system substrate-binding protein
MITRRKVTAAIAGALLALGIGLGAAASAGGAAHAGPEAPATWYHASGPENPATWYHA